MNLKHFSASVLLLFWLLSVACQSSPASGLPFPKNVGESALANLRPLTNSGRALGAVWSPDGQSLAYTVLAFAPKLVSYHNANAQPKTEVWLTPASGEGARMLDIGVALFYSKDGKELYYQLYGPAAEAGAGAQTPSVYAINPSTMKTRHFLGTQGFANVTSLADGRLALSEVGTSAPLRIFNPATGERTAWMTEHPSNTPQDARYSPDGKLLAYTDLLEAYLSQANGSAPILLSTGAGGSAKFWWSPNSQYLAYTTGSSVTDKLLLADRQGKTKATLFPLLSNDGYISSVEWSPDSRWMLVSAESFTQFDYPTRIYLFDREGNHQLLLESYLSASPAWSPDGRSLAFSLWIGPQSDEPAFDIWLADLTDAKTAASLPSLSLPAPKPTPTLVSLPAELTPEQVIARFWDAINQQEYHAAWSMLSKAGRILQRYPEFKAFYECMQTVSVSTSPLQQDADTMIFSLSIDYQRDPACNADWQQPNDIYAILIRDASLSPGATPWQIECFSDQPSCIK